MTYEFDGRLQKHSGKTTGNTDKKRQQHHDIPLWKSLKQMSQRSEYITYEKSGLHVC